MSSGRRTERLLNLVICLLHTSAYLPATRLRELVPGYAEAASEDAFKRMFERDKEDLRDLGIPLEVGSFGAWDDDPGYRIRQQDYALPPIELAPDEAAAVGLAARMWSTAALSADVTRALRKLEAAGVDVTELPDGLQPRAAGGDNGFPGVVGALSDGRVIRFGYRRAEDTEVMQRTVEPWGVVLWRGRWYLVGHDRDREATRVFRLSRVIGEPVATGRVGAVIVPPGVDLAKIVASSDSGGVDLVATIRVRVGKAHDLRRTATATTQADEAWELLTLPCPDPYRLAERVLPLGPDAVVLEPQIVRDIVVSRLRELV